LRFPLCQLKIGVGFGYLWRREKSQNLAHQPLSLRHFENMVGVRGFFEDSQAAIVLSTRLGINGGREGQQPIQ